MVTLLGFAVMVVVFVVVVSFMAFISWLDDQALLAPICGVIVGCVILGGIIAASHDVGEKVLGMFQ